MRWSTRWSLGLSVSRKHDALTQRRHRKRKLFEERFARLLRQAYSVHESAPCHVTGIFKLDVRQKTLPDCGFESIGGEDDIGVVHTSVAERYGGLIGTVLDRDDGVARMVVNVRKCGAQNVIHLDAERTTVCSATFVTTTTEFLADSHLSISRIGTSQPERRGEFGPFHE